MVGLFGCLRDAGASGRFNFEAAGLRHLHSCACFRICGDFLCRLELEILLLLISGVLVALPIVWNSLYDYQRQRVLTLLDPSSDPLGAGFHTLQAIIAIGSGGMTGKGWMNGTQAHLDFIPERTSDFLFAVFSEEFGFSETSVF